MITTTGKVHIKRFLGGLSPVLAASIGFGIGNKAEAIGDTALQFEVARADIIFTSYDFVNDLLIFKASVPDTLTGTVYEVCLYDTPSDFGAADFGPRLIASFDSASESWVDNTTGSTDTYTVSNTRLGINSLSHVPNASAAKTSALRDRYLDLSGYSGADKFSLAYNVGNGNTSGIRILFLTDAANYFSYSLGAQTAGYKVTNFTKGSAAVTGSPDWSTINQILVETTSGAGGASAVDYDGLRIEDVDGVALNQTMISRELLATPYVTESDMTQDIEFSMVVSL